MIKVSDLTQDPRLAGAVKRYHTHPVVQEQSVAAHSWNVVRILLAIHPEAPRHLILYSQFHDVGEIRSGDIPFTAKRSSPELKAAVNKLEASGHQSMVIPWGVPGPVVLTDAEAQIHKLADIMEMWEKGIEEYLLGNHFGRCIVDNCEIAIAEILKDLASRQEHDVVARAGYYMKRRVSVWGAAYDH